MTIVKKIKRICFRLSPIINKNSNKDLKILQDCMKNKKRGLIVLFLDIIRIKNLKAPETGIERFDKII